MKYNIQLQWKKLHGSAVGSEEYMRARSVLVNHYSQFADKLSYNLYRELNIMTTLEDLKSEAYYALTYAIDTFDPSLNCKFETYAYMKMRFAILKMQRNSFWAPRAVQDKINITMKEISKYVNEYDQPPSISHIEKTLQISEDMMSDVLKWKLQFSLLSYCGSEDGDSESINDMLDKAKSLTLHTNLMDTCEIVSEGISHESLHNACQKLPERLHYVIEQYYCNDCSYAEIATKMNISTSRALQLHGKSVKCLKSILEKDKSMFA